MADITLERQELLQCVGQRVLPLVLMLVLLTLTWVVLAPVVAPAAVARQ